MFALLREALAAQYDAFQAPRPSVVSGCECCTTPDQLAGLVAAPREELPAGCLDFYARKAMSTVGTADDFRYFWPRLAEVAMRGELTTEVEVLFGKPLYGEHRTWPRVEQDAMVGFATAIGEWLAVERLLFLEVDSWACAMGRLVEGLTDVCPLLEPLLADTPEARANLRGFSWWNGGDGSGSRLLYFWHDAPEGRERVLHWLTTYPVIEAVERATREVDDDDFPW